MYCGKKTTQISDRKIFLRNKTKLLKLKRLENKEKIPIVSIMDFFQCYKNEISQYCNIVEIWNINNV